MPPPSTRPPRRRPSAASSRPAPRARRDTSRGGAPTPRPRAARTPSRARRWWVRPVLAAAAVVVLAGVALAGFQAARDGALPGTRVAGIDVGGMQEPELLARVQVLADRRLDRPLDATRDGQTIPSTAGELGYVLDVPATVQAVLARGRQRNPVAALRDHVVATTGQIVVRPVEAFDDTAFQDWVDRIAGALGLQSLVGDVLVVGAEVQLQVPTAGETIDVDGLRAATLAALDDPDVVTVEVPTRVTTPSADPDRLQVLTEQARQAISGPVTLTRPGVSLTFPAALIGQLLEVRAQPVSGDAGEADLVLGIGSDGISATISPEQFATMQREPQDAEFAVTGASVEVIPAQQGFQFDARMAADQLLAVATGDGPRTAELEGRRPEPDRSTDELLALGVTEQVATFTTDHPCCQGRVTNIQRIADIVDGTVLQPGERFSLNAAVGPRTLDNGFVDGGAISGGEFIEQIGGGVSQFSTTLFNAIFLGGYQIDEFRPHSYYIDRYPVGREATLNYDPPIDLAFTNDSPDAIFIDTSYADTSVTVSLYSTRWAHVETTTSDRYGFREPEEQREETDELPLGEERVLQSGRQGFSVDFSREIRYVDGRTETERYTTYYLPEPRIIEVGTRSDEEPEPTEEPAPEPEEPDPVEVPAPPTVDPAPPEAEPQPEPTTVPDPPSPAARQ